jgi:hypothetical protein
MVMSQIRMAAMTSTPHRFAHEVAENDGILPHLHNRESKRAPLHVVTVFFIAW